MLAVSGVYFNWMDEFTHAVEIVSPVTPRYGDAVPARDTPLIDPPVSWGSAQSAALTATNDAALDMLFLRPRAGIYEARFYDRRDIDTYGRRLVSIDAETGAVLDDRHVATGSGGDVFIAWQYPLHSGKAFGWPGRLIVFAAGVATILLSWTGILIWLRKRRARRA
ncbi:MAG TPA: PepSY-associated TM helix domain-containing protein [Terricaulis sp.]|nr:PepSY-associated TM helix domain-containing protein [Terricaulis sp.]HRP11644.1 PepSY-associated TM helix domain-containing protein [Terricaulis sp.]